MGLYAIKPAFVRRLRRIEDLLVSRNVRPDTLTRAAVIVSVLAGLSVAAGGAFGRPAIWLAVPPLVLLRLALNALDGSIARRTRRTTALGAMRNEVGDRLSDAALIGALAVVAIPPLALAALAAAFLSSSIGVLAQAMTGTRDYAGPVGKPDRAASIAVAATVAAFTGDPRSFTIAASIILIGSLLSASIRAGRLRAALRTPPVRVHADARPHFVSAPLSDQIEIEALYGYAR